MQEPAAVSMCTNSVAELISIDMMHIYIERYACCTLHSAFAQMYYMWYCMRSCIFTCKTSIGDRVMALVCVCVRAATRSGYSTAKSLSAYSIQYINTICWYVAHFNDGYKWLWKQILQKLSQRATSQRTNNSILKYSMLLWLLHLSIRMIQIIAVRARTFAHINGENQWMDDAVNYFRKIYIEMAVWIYLLCAQ